MVNLGPLSKAEPVYELGKAEPVGHVFRPLDIPPIEWSTAEDVEDSEGWTCAYCESELDEGQKKCPNCGAPRRTRRSR